MTKQTSKNAVLIYNGYKIHQNASAYTIEAKFAAEDVTGFGEQSQNFVPGILTAKMGWDFFWDQAALQTHAALGALAAPPGYATMLPEGYTLGCRSINMVCQQVNYNPAGAASGSPISVGTIQFEYNGEGPGLEFGECLYSGTITNTLSGSTAVPDAYNILTATTAISAATIQVFTPTAADTYVVKVQTSDDGATSWGDWITFTVDGLTRTAQRVTHASGAVKAYRRIVATRTGGANNPFGFNVTFWRAG